MNKIGLKDYLKENLKLEVSTYPSAIGRHQVVKLVLEGEVISEVDLT